LAQASATTPRLVPGRAFRHWRAMAPKARGDGKATDGETKSGGGRGKGGGKNRGGDAQWSNEGEEDGGRRNKGQGKGNRKGGKADGGGGDDRWHQSGGKNQQNRGQGQQRGGYEEDYYEGSSGHGYGGGSGYGYGYDSWQAGPQDWQPMPQEPAPAPPPKIWTEYAAPDATPYYYNCRTGLTQWDRPKELDPPPPEPAPAKSANDSDTGKGRGRTDGASYDDSSRSGGRGRSDNRRPDDDRQKGAGRRGGRGNRDGGGGRGGGDKGGTKQDPSDFGPPGCNLFVFHLPDDWTDDDLHEYFAPHGNVVSAKVMKELGTGRSRGFGFVSYEERVGAATAVKKMQGYKILGKRLKVEFKKGEGESSLEDGILPADEDGGSTKKSYPDDERLIGYLRAISAKNVVQSLKENEGGPDDGDRFDGDHVDGARIDGAHEFEEEHTPLIAAKDLPDDD